MLMVADVQTEDAGFLHQIAQAGFDDQMLTTNLLKTLQNYCDCRHFPKLSYNISQLENETKS